MSTNPDDWRQLLESMADIMRAASVADVVLLTLAGVSAAFALGIVLYVLVVVPIKATSGVVGAGIAWLTRRDWRWLRQTLVAIGAVVVAAVVVALSAMAVHGADPLAEIILLIVAAVVLTVVVAFLVFRAVVYTRKATRAVIRILKR
jgi:hypothetical protein